VNATPFPQSPDDVNQTLVELQVSELHLAILMLARAAKTGNHEVISYNRANARKAFNSVIEWLPTLKLTVEQRAWIGDRLFHLVSRLAEASTTITT
jgi:hypothetical protein